VCEGLPPELRANAKAASFALASGVLRAFFDPEWVERHIISDEYKPGFMSIDESQIERQEITFFRGMDLAEVIDNLQLVPGFDECITRMRDGDIEGTYAEHGFLTAVKVIGTVGVAAVQAGFPTAPVRDELFHCDGALAKPECPLFGLRGEDDVCGPLDLFAQGSERRVALESRRAVVAACGDRDEDILLYPRALLPFRAEFVGIDLELVSADGERGDVVGHRLIVRAP
jgi:hypothetical protein